jgi:hypothetical protein
MKHLGWPAILALAVVGIVIAGIGGALIANATSDDDDDSEQAAAALSAADSKAILKAPMSPATDRAQSVVVESDDVPLGKTEARRVGRAALQAAGGGTVVEIGRSDDPGEAYEVEVLTARGEIDIALDQNLHRVQNLAYDD